MKAVVISGFLYNLSDNIIPFLDEQTDVYIHTWDVEDNHRWITKADRYKKYCNNFKVIIEKPIYDYKLYSYFYSTWKSVNLIDDFSKYDKIVKFKPNLNTNIIKYKGDTDKYYKKAKIQTRPLLDNVSKEDCIFGSIYYQTLDERLFTGHSKGFQKAFKIEEKNFKSEMFELNINLQKQYGTNYEGSIFWKEWLEKKKLFLILDTDLVIPDNYI